MGTRMLRATIAGSLLLAASATAEGALFRAYLASDGNDANPCTLPAPCRLLPAALAAIDPGGQVWMLDSANYNGGTVSITKSATILAVPGAVGSLVVTGGHAIDINTPGVEVSLRNLVINRLPGAGSAATHGINAASAGVLNVDGCVLQGLPGTAIMAGQVAEVNIADTTIRDNNFGIYATGASTVNVTRTLVTGHMNVGIWAVPAVGNTTVLVVSDTVSSNNSYGIVASGEADRIARTFVTRSVASGNLYNGFYAWSGGLPGDSFMELSSSLAARNGTGLVNFGATFQSAGNNRSSGNVSGDVYGSITPTASY